MTDMSPKPRPGPGPKPAGPTHPTPTHPPRGNGHALPPLPRLGEIIRDAERTLRQAINTLGRQYDPESGPLDALPLTPTLPDRILGSVVAEIRYALELLGDLADMALPPAGSAVHVPGPPLALALDEGDGPPSHRRTTGEGVDARPVQDAAAPGVPLGEARSDLAESQRAGDSFSLPVPPDWHWLNTK